MSDPYDMVSLRYDEREKMDEFDFFIDEDEFEVFVDHEAGFDDCDPGMLAWSEAQLARWD